MGITYVESVGGVSSHLMRRAADIEHVMIGVRLSEDDLLIALPCVEHTVNKELDV